MTLTEPIKLTDARQRAEDARREIEKAQEALAASVKEAIAEGFEEIFDRYEFLGSVAWTQYTPYFNDGEPCVFGSTFTYPSLNTLRDVSDQTCSSYEEGGEDFNRHANRERYVGPEAGTYRSVYVPNDEYIQAYQDCRTEVLEFTKALAGDEHRSYTDTTPTSFDAALLKAFGDHALIKVRRDGAGVVVEAVSYDHD